MLAVIKTGGKQYAIKKGDKVKVEKLDAQVGDTITFEEVLAFGDEKSATVGAPAVKGAIVEAKVVAQDRHAKVTGIKHKAKKRYKMKFGHRQAYTEVEITKIGK